MINVHVETLVQALGQIVYDWRPTEGKLFWGGDYERILGYGELEVGETTQSWTERVHPDDLDRVMHEVEDCTRERRFYDLEYRFRRSDGRYAWMHDRGVPFFEDGGALDRIVGVFSDISERKSAQMALQRLAARQRQLTRRLAETEESERRKISRELHDRVGQSLSSLLLSLEVLRQDPALCASVGVQRRLDDAHALTRKAIEDTRDLMSESRPPALDEFGLLAALRSHAEVFTARTGVKVSVRGGTPPPLSGIAQTALFRIAQEALVNVAKHAGATRVEVSLGSRQDGAELSIADNGRGFDPVLSERGSSWGLRTMRERAEAVGATLHIDSRRGGTTVSAWVPT